MLDWDSIKRDHEGMIAKLAGPGLPGKERVALQKKASAYSTAIDLHDQIVALERERDDNAKQAEQESGELKELHLEEVERCEQERAELNKQLDDYLYPADERDSRSVFLEIRSGAGGQEAALFAADLFRMYHTYALERHWEVSIAEEHTTDIGGYSKIVVYIKGKNAYKHLKFESGVHRVQRVPKTETAGRVHTSTVTVAVIPEVDDVEINIDPNDLRIDTFRSSGAGGQHVNTTDSAVRITHIPTGVVSSCQDERSQTKNKNKAMKALKAKLFEAEQKRKDAVERAQRKQQVGTGERSEKIRTYNFPQNRVTDHRTGVTLKKLDIVMEGQIRDLLEPLFEWDAMERRKQGTLFEQS